MIGTSAQSCWLAEACKILLLLDSLSRDSKPPDGLAERKRSAWCEKVCKLLHQKPQRAVRCWYCIQLTYMHEERCNAAAHVLTPHTYSTGCLEACHTDLPW